MVMMFLSLRLNMVIYHNIGVSPCHPLKLMREGVPLPSPRTQRARLHALRSPVKLFLDTYQRFPPVSYSVCRIAFTILLFRTRVCLTCRHSPFSPSVFAFVTYNLCFRDRLDCYQLPNPLQTDIGYYGDSVTLLANCQLRQSHVLIDSKIQYVRVSRSSLSSLLL